MSLHPTIAAALKRAEGIPPVETLAIGEARAVVKARYPLPDNPVPVAAVEDLVIDHDGCRVPVRIYTPAGQAPHPIIAFFHGSGFVCLDLDTHDDICRRLCVGAGAIVVSVDYRLAPEHPFPAAPADCLAATRWIIAQAPKLGGLPANVAVCGDSAGGCLAAATAWQLKAESALKAQLLFYPVLDYDNPARASYQAFASGYGLTASTMRWYWSQYLPDAAKADDPLACPLRAPDHSGLPRTLIILPEFDVLRDEALEYESKLRAAGVDARVSAQPGMNHGFLKWVGGIETASAAMDEACAWLRTTMA